MEKITIDGFLGKDAEVRKSKNGQNYITFSVGARSGVNATNKTDWYDVRQFNYTENLFLI